MEVFQLSLYLRIPEDQVVTTLIENEHERLQSLCTRDIETMTDRIASFRGIKPERVESTLVEECWDEMIRERLNRKWTDQNVVQKKNRYRQAFWAPGNHFPQTDK